MRYLVLAAIGLVVGCGGGEEPKPTAVKPAAPTATPTPTPSLEPTGEVGESERATQELQDFLLEHTQSASYYCTPMVKAGRGSLASFDCDYAGDPEGHYFLFASRKAMRDYYDGTRTLGEAVDAGRCGRGMWEREGKNQGRLGVYRIADTATVLVWTDDSERVAGVILSPRASGNELCSLWLRTA